MECSFLLMHAVGAEGGPDQQNLSDLESNGDSVMNGDSRTGRRRRKNEACMKCCLH